jgi:hypothetical protein
MRLLSCIVCVLIAVPSMAQESTIHAEFRREAEAIKQNCGDFDSIADCAVTLATGHPLHVAFGSIAPQNGMGFGAAFVGHKTPSENWRLNWSADVIGAFSGAWRAGAYLKFVNTNVQLPVVIPDPGAGPTSTAVDVHPYPIYTAYVQGISLPTIWYYGLGPSTSRDDKTAFRFGETIIGGNAIVPINRLGALNLSLLGELNGRFADVRSGDETDVPSIEQLYTETTAPGLTTQPGFVQFGEGLRVMPSLLSGGLALNYLLQFQQFVAPSDSTYSFHRWTVDLKHEIPLYRNSRWPTETRDANTPNDCAVSPALDRCPAISRNRTGTIGFRAFVSRSDVGPDSVVPFYFQQTLGGSDINGSRMLPSYDDYRFRGPHLFFLQESIEHSLGTWPVGVWVAADQGRVSLFDDDGDSGDVRYSISTGLTLRAGGFPVATLSLGTGGSEGSHVAFTISTSLLGGSPRPSLH